MERLVLTARVEEEDSRFVARVDGLDVQAEGESADVAQAELIQAMITWISARDCSDNMAETLAGAGFPEIDEETELHLEFANSVAPSDSDPGCDSTFEAGLLADGHPAAEWHSEGSMRQVDDD